MSNRAVLFLGLCVVQGLYGTTAMSEDPHPVVLERVVEGDGTYIPGETVDITVTISHINELNLLSIGFQETLPEGWIFQQIVSDIEPPIAEQFSESRLLEFGFIEIPAFPFTLTYRVGIPNWSTGMQEISGNIFYYLSSDLQTTEVLKTMIPQSLTPLEGEGTEGEEEGSIEGQVEGEPVSPGCFSCSCLEEKFNHTMLGDLFLMGVALLVLAGARFH